ncbi:MAG: HNH endonuclease signature motif containing protein [Candidatus Ranarchaeia archaeon]
MNYSLIYEQLIENRRINQITDEYVERHHIIPKSLGGSDENDNIVSLSGREHYIAHLLLHKIHNRKETAYALWMMQCKSHTNDKRPHIKNSRMYEWARKEFSKHISKSAKSRVGNKNTQFGTMWISNIEMKQNKKISKKDSIPEGWVKGRNIWNKKIPTGRVPNVYINNGKRNSMICEGDEIPNGWSLGFKLQESTRKKLHDASSGKTQSEESKKKISKRMKQFQRSKSAPLA